MNLFKHLPIAALHVDAQGRILESNSRAHSLFSQTEPLAGRNIEHFFALEDVSEFFDFFQKLADQPDLSLETTLYPPERQLKIQVIITGSVVDSVNRILTFERSDPYGPGCSKRCNYATILETQFQTSPMGILVVNSKMEMISFNHEYVQIWDISKEIQESRNEQESVLKILDKVLDPEAFIAKIKALYANQEETITDEIQLKDGRSLYRHSYPIYNKDTYLGRVWHFLDITPLKQAHYQIEKQRSFQNAILNHIQDGIIACDADGKITLLNRASQELFGLTCADTIPSKYNDVEINSPDGSPLSAEASPLSLALVGRTINNMECTTISGTGTSHALRVSGQPMYDSEQKQLGAVISLHDITDLNKAKEQLHFLAYHDSLTGLPNRRLFHDLLQQSLKQAYRNNQQVGVLFLDLDNFKGINDKHGHEVGDKVLTEVATCLLQCLRESDIICRWGGDEFVIGLLESSGTSGILKVAEKLGKAVQNCVHHCAETEQISISIGISTYPLHGSMPDRLIRNADVAMYTAKRKGKNRCELFELI